VNVAIVDSSGAQKPTDEVFVGEWRPGRKICVAAQRHGSEKTIISLKQGGWAKEFAFYELPPIAASPSASQSRSFPLNDDDYLKKSGEEGRQSIFALRKELFISTLNEQQRDVLWRAKWDGTELIVPQCILGKVYRDHFDCAITLPSYEGSTLAADFTSPLSDELFLRYREGMNCKVRGRLFEMPGAWHFMSRPCMANDSPPCLVLKLKQATLNCAANAG
jgi:hypothetical protein